MKFLSLFIFSIYSFCSFAAYDPCKYFSFNSCDNGSSINSSIGSSQPSSSRSFSSPSSLGSVEGFGVEGIVWSGLDLSIVSGNGRVGGGASSSNTDDTFFGNSSKEEYYSYVDRKVALQSYDFEKYTFGAGLSLLSKKSSKLFSLNIGAVSKYISSSGNFHFGGALSASLGPLNFAYSKYKDEGIDIDSGRGVSTPIVFIVDSYSVGLSLGIFNIDYTVFDNRTNYTDKIEIFSSSLVYKKTTFSFGVRIENGPLPEVNLGEGVINTQEEEKKNQFLAFQYNFRNDLSAGLLHNYFLSDELSIIATYFF
ncbi:hypothetical protein [Halobacteriovorax sp. HLS]|uniref:hypothetical protein n=1 Tax=Halobacteriovorax sp. HLS TaxID=2234000 RepID=UPI000FD77C4D|nr:hypothetical protein [Halobacteriovorax sp. HLS]